MDKQMLQFAVLKTDSVITGIGKSYIPHPVIRFNGNGIRWHEDSPKQQHSSKNG